MRACRAMVRESGESAIILWRDDYIFYHGKTVYGTRQSDSAECIEELDASGSGWGGDSLFGDEDGAAETALEAQRCAGTMRW